MGLRIMDGSLNPFAHTAKGSPTKVDFTVCKQGNLGLTVEQYAVSEELSEINAERFEKLFDSCKEKLYVNWKLCRNGTSFDVWLTKMWDDSAKRFRL